MPTEIGPALDAANRGLAVLPKDKIASLLDETAQAVGGLGPALQRLVDATQAIAGDFKTNIQDINDIIQNSGPIIDSQVNSGDAIERWAHNLNILAAQSAENDQHVQRILTQAAPTADQVNAVFSDVRESLPQTLANLEIVLDMLKRYHKGVEQLLVAYPQGGAEGQTVTAPFPGYAALGTSLTINQPPPCLTGFLPHLWRSPAIPAWRRCRPEPISPHLSGGLRRIPAWHRCRPEHIARSRRTLRPTPCAGHATFRVSMSPVNALRRRGSAATPSHTFRRGPTPGMATPTRS